MDHNRRIRIAASLLALTLLIGVAGYKLIGGPQWSVLDCVYMTVITLTTVGYGETHDMADQPGLRIFTMIILLFGLGTMTYAFTTITSFIVEGELNLVLKRRRMSKGISDLKDHYIVCGVGETGTHIIEELQRTRRPFVAIDASPERIERLLALGDFFHIIDDAMDDSVLERAGVARAAGLLACLTSDRDNLFLTISARQMNPSARIVAKAVDVKTRAKLLKAGADAVVSPQFIGGLRLVSEMVRPQVVSFLDAMMRDERATIRIEEVPIPAGSPVAGLSVSDSRIREKTGLLILAIREPTGQGYQYNPGPASHIKAASILVVMGEVLQIQSLRTMVAPVPGGAA
jgi:voltage-gated potassium channel